MGFDVRNIDLSDIVRAGKQDRKADFQYGGDVVSKPQKPLEGVTAQQRKRNQEIGDVLNIGAGTRCTDCGFLHFMWRATCGACEKPMEYNMGHRDDTKRL
tara:strand:+ start:1025 stop:1324 length:300 start_codon:yes stop_codon:yes gene_type:complete